MEDFSKLFYEEAQDLLSTLEETLLLLEENPNDNELINEVFRIMHSLKGSGAMFGFVNLSSFTHDLESLYDQIRSNKIELNSEIISFTMNAIDLINNLLNNDSSSDLKDEITSRKTMLNNLLGIGSVTEDDNTINIITQKPNKPNRKKSKTKVYYIRFEPNQDILNDGTNPLYLIDELVDLGQTILVIDSKKIPEFNKINTELCYINWTIILSTEANNSDIDDVFIFVEDDSKITVELLSTEDIFTSANAKSTFEYLLKTKPTDIESFKRIAITLEEELLQHQTTTTVENIANQDDERKIAIIGNDDEKPVIKPLKKTVKIQDSFNIDTVKVSASKLDSLINLVSELVTTQARLVIIADKAKSDEITGLSEDFQQLSRQFRDVAFDMRLIPIQTMLVKFKRLVRDLSKSLNKKVSLVTDGTDTELDKNIIATISDPIMHIIRNSIDHGIEAPEIRLKNNKPETGTIYFKAEHSGTSIIITIKDDGAGINTDKVLEKAIDKKFIQPNAILTEREIYNLILLPGFSTNDAVSNVSGRGVGMDVVRKKISELRGDINISSKLGLETKIMITLPLTLSIIDGLLISINSNKFVIPLSAVKQIHQITIDAIKNSYNNVVEIDGQQIPIIDLTKEFNKDNDIDESLHLISVDYHEKTIGIIVNELISEYQAVLKPIDDLLKNNEIFAGATILGDGKIALVLDTNKIIDFYSNNNME